MTVDILGDLRDACDSLTEPHQIRNPRHTWSPTRNKVTLPDHVVTLPGLLQQLADMAYPGRPTDGGDFVMRPIPGSRPPLQLRAVSAHAFITVGIVRWCWSLQLDLRDTAESNLRQVLAAAGRQDRDTQIALLDEVRGWRRQAEVITGWRDPDPELQAPCPHCGERGLRVNLAERTARCSGCRSRWAEEVDPEAGIWSIGVLGQHIAEHQRGSKAAADRVRAEERDRKARRAGKAVA